MSTLRNTMGGQAFTSGILIRGKRNAAAFRKSNGELEVRTWPAPPPVRRMSKVPVIRGISVLATAMAQGGRATMEGLRLIGRGDKSGPRVEKLRRYHGAEHKAIACWERGLELSVQNAAAQSRIHPRCGTCVAVTAFITNELLLAALPRGISPQRRQAVEIGAMLASVGLSYELNRLAWKGNPVAEALTAPGRWAQHVTTAEPDERTLECALAAVKAAAEGE